MQSSASLKLLLPYRSYGCMLKRAPELQPKWKLRVKGWGVFDSPGETIITLWRWALTTVTQSTDLWFFFLVDSAVTVYSFTFDLYCADTYQSSQVKKINNLSNSTMWRKSSGSHPLWLTSVPVLVCEPEFMCVSVLVSVSLRSQSQACVAQSSSRPF